MHESMYRKALSRGTPWGNRGGYFTLQFSEPTAPLFRPGSANVPNHLLLGRRNQSSIDSVLPKGKGPLRVNEFKVKLK
jgi:hypothetical protein